MSALQDVQRGSTDANEDGCSGFVGNILDQLHREVIWTREIPYTVNLASMFSPLVEAYQHNQEGRLTRFRVQRNYDQWVQWRNLVLRLAE